MNQEWVSLDPTLQVLSFKFKLSQPNNSQTLSGHFKDFRGKNIYSIMIKDELDNFEEHLHKFYSDFPVKKVRSGSSSIIPDPIQYSSPKSFWSEPERIEY